MRASLHEAGRPGDATRSGEAAPSTTVGGFATLAAVSLLVLTIALVAAAVLSSQQSLLERGRTERQVESQVRAWGLVGDLLTALQTSWNADAQSFDHWWAECSHSYPSGTLLLSLSGRLNLNTVTPFLLMDSELGATLLKGSVEDFTSFRSKEGPFAEVASYKAYFRPEALNELYCCVSSFDLNTADEIMLEKVIALRTGSEAIASTVRARVREFRGSHRIFAPSDWELLIGAEKEAVGELVTTEPELDVNTASPIILQALLRDPDWKLERADAKLQLILSGRASRPWNPESLRQALGVDKNSLLLQYLGTRCRFIQGEVPLGSSRMSFIAVIGYSADSPPKLDTRIIATSWTSS